MRIRCPACSATYEVADALLDPPRMVRCAKCAHDWMAEPVIETAMAEAQAEAAIESAAAVAQAEEPAAAGPAAQNALEAERAAHLLAARGQVPEPEPERVVGDTPLSAIERLAAPADLSARIRRRDRLLTVAWAASFAALAAMGVAGYTQRDQLMRQWPASKRVYATLGLLPPAMKSGDGNGGNPPSPR